MNRAYSLIQVKEVSDKRRVFTGMATTPETDRMGDTVNPLGATFRNPVTLLHQHKHDMLHSKGVNWAHLDDGLKRGTYAIRRKRAVPFSASELEQLPAKHAARTDPNLVVMRSVVDVAPLPPLSRVVNRVDVLFDGAEPVLAEVPRG